MLQVGCWELCCDIDNKSKERIIERFPGTEIVEESSEF